MVFGHESKQQKEETGVLVRSVYLGHISTVSKYQLITTHDVIVFAPESDRIARVQYYYNSILLVPLIE